MSYLYGTNTELIYSLGTAITKNTYTTAAPITAPASGSTWEHALIPVSFWSGSSAVGKALHVHAQGTIANTAAATFIGQISLDAVIGTQANSVTYWPVLAPTAATTSLWELNVRYTCAQGGQAGQFQVNGYYEQSVVASGTLSTAPQNVRFQTLLTSISLEAPLYAELWGTWSASSASNTTTVQQFQVFGLN